MAPEILLPPISGLTYASDSRVPDLSLGMSEFK